MYSRLSKGDKDILSLIAVYRVLTVNQLAAITQRSRAVIRRRLRFLSKQNLSVRSVRGFGRGPGRPEEIVLLTEDAAKNLKKEGLLLKNAPLFTPKSVKSISVDHELLVNWFYIHLVQMEASIQELSTRPHAPRIVLKHQEEIHGFVDPRIQIGTGDESIEFIPDGIFSVSHKGAGKSLLFFLEVDMDTESVAGLNRSPKDIRQKILNYQTIFRSGHYKRYEKCLGSNFNGFRLLFMANNSARLGTLSRLVQEMPPSEFIWLTDQERMFSYGLSGEIWFRGGKMGRGPESIIGSRLNTPSPVIDSIR